MNGTLPRKMSRANPGQGPWTGGPWGCVYTLTGAKLVSCDTDTGFGFPFCDEFDVLRSYLGMVWLTSQETTMTGSLASIKSCLSGVTGGQ